MKDLSIRFHQVSFAYDTATLPLFRELSLHLPRGWTGVVGANGVGKSTILKLATGRLMPRKGRVEIPEFSIYCPQRTDRMPDGLGGLIGDMSGEAFELRGRLEIGDDWVGRWHSLSHGERKRAQIGAALWQNPEVLAVDEPTNHLDAEARELLFKALVAFAGVGILVSHDRRLLDGLCGQCLFIDPPDAVLRPGNYTRGLAQSKLEESAMQRSRNKAGQEFSRLKKESAKRRHAASRADQRRSKRGLTSKDRDSREKRDRARVSGKDGADGKRLNQLSGRLDQARKRLEKAGVKKKYSMGIWMPGAKSKRDTLFNLPAGSLPLGKERRLEFPDLCMRPDERVALTGANGSGKSTLIDHIMRSLNLETRRVIYLPQEIDLNESRDIMVRVRNLPGDRLGRMMTVVSCLGSRPRRLLESMNPSPGEIRKMLIAGGIAREPHLIVMDEPTNHLDLPSIECLEASLRDCPCGMLLVSHDQVFLNALTHTSWRIAKHKESAHILQLHIS